MTKNEIVERIRVIHEELSMDKRAFMDKVREDERRWGFPGLDDDAYYPYMIGRLKAHIESLLEEARA